MTQLSFLQVLVRMLTAALCGGLIGIERGRKNRPAGFRTYMLVCMGASLTMILSTFLAVMIDAVWMLPEELAKTDLSRFGAQVINGIGFLGAGTIIITGRQQVKGMTTAAGLWASACMGLAIGVGFYEAALIGCLLILITIVVFSHLERFLTMRSRNVNVYVEFEHVDDMGSIITTLKEQGIRIFDVELTKGKNAESGYPNVIVTMRLPRHRTHTDVITSLAQLRAVRAIEEL